MEARGPVEIVPYDEQWPIQAASEAARLAPLGRVEHIGSTAVPGLASKPILDLMLGVADLRAIVAPVEALGYSHYQSYEAILSERRYFWRGDPSRHTHHLHAVPLNGPFWRVHLRFRDRLRADGDIARAYERLKRDLAGRFPDDRDAYTDAKAEFIRAALADQSQAYPNQ